MFFAESDWHAGITRALGDLKPIAFLCDRTGTQIVFSEPADIS